jgi:hypothetical protein
MSTVEGLSRVVCIDTHTHTCTKIHTKSFKNKKIDLKTDLMVPFQKFPLIPHARFKKKFCEVLLAKLGIRSSPQSI